MHNHETYYTHKRTTGYYGVEPLYPGRATQTHAPRCQIATPLSEIDTGASLGSLVDDLSCSPFAVKLPGEDDPVGGLFEEKEQILRARVKHLADTLASRYELRDGATSMMNYEQCKLQGEIWNLERWPLGIQPIEAKKAKLESDMLRLEKDKADEATTAWKDAFAVKGDFLEAISELRKVQSQRSIFAESPELMPIDTGYGESLMY